MLSDKLYNLVERIRIPDFGAGKEESIMYALRGRETYYLQELKPGMVLAEPVMDRSGQRLLNSDIRLDDKKIEQLRTRGISSVRVRREEGYHER